MVQKELDLLIKIRKRLVDDIDNAERAHMQYEGDPYGEQYKVAAQYLSSHLNFLDREYPELKEISES